MAAGSSKSQVKVELGASLDSYRAAHGLTQAELAARLKTSQPTLSRLLANNGNPRPALRQRIAALLATPAVVAAPESWVAAVQKAAESSPAFRAIVDAGLLLVNSDG